MLVEHEENFQTAAIVVPTSFGWIFVMWPARSLSSYCRYSACRVLTKRSSYVTVFWLQSDAIRGGCIVSHRILVLMIEFNPR